MKTPGFTADVSLYKTNVRYQLITQQAAIGGGQAVIPQSSCDGYAWISAGWGALALKAYEQGDTMLAEGYMLLWADYGAAWQACEATAHTP